MSRLESKAPSRDWPFPSAREDLRSARFEWRMRIRSSNKAGISLGFSGKRAVTPAGHTQADPQVWLLPVGLIADEVDGAVGRAPAANLEQ